MLYFLLGALVLAALGVLNWYKFWMNEAGKPSGYLPPATSWFAKFMFLVGCKVVAFLTVGPVKVIGKAPASGRVVFLANHQVPSDFAMLRLGAGRHYRALGSKAQFPGFIGALAAWAGVFTVTYATKEERAAAEAACVQSLARKRQATDLSAPLVLALLAVLASVFLFLVLHGAYLASLSALVLTALLGASKGGDPVLGIAPQGALMPDNVLKAEEFRAGGVRIARAVAEQCREPVLVVPVAIHYKRDPKDRHWTHRFLKKTRSLFLGMRNPKWFDPLFKTELADYPEACRKAVEALRAAKMAAYKRSHVTSYGGVVLVGEAIDASTLPADPKEAIELVRLIIADMLEKARLH